MTPAFPSPNFYVLNSKYYHYAVPGSLFWRPGRWDSWHSCSSSLETYLTFSVYVLLLFIDSFEQSQSFGFVLIFFSGSHTDDGTCILSQAGLANSVPVDVYFSHLTQATSKNIDQYRESEEILWIQTSGMLAPKEGAEIGCVQKSLRVWQETVGIIGLPSAGEALPCCSESQRYWSQGFVPHSIFFRRVVLVQMVTSTNSVISKQTVVVMWTLQFSDLFHTEKPCSLRLG